MRRWVCIVALLAGFSADGYPRGARLVTPIPIERLIAPPTGGLRPTLAWWRTPGPRRPT